MDRPSSVCSSWSTGSHVPSRDEVEAMCRSFSRWLRAANRSETTVETYVSSVDQLVRFAEGMGTDPLSRDTVTE